LAQAIRLKTQKCSRPGSWGTAGRAPRKMVAAINPLSAAIRRDGRNWNAWSSRAQARHRDGDFQGAEADYDQAIALNPRLSASYERRAAVRQARGNLRGAISDHDSAIALKPSAIKYCIRAKVRAEQGDLQGALADYDAGIGLNPGFAGDFSHRAMLKLRLEDFAGAADDLEHATNLDPQAGRCALESALGETTAKSSFSQCLKAGDFGREVRLAEITRI